MGRIFKYVVGTCAVLGAGGAAYIGFDRSLDIVHGLWTNNETANLYRLMRSYVGDNGTVASVTGGVALLGGLAGAVIGAGIGDISEKLVRTVRRIRPYNSQK